MKFGCIFNLNYNHYGICLGIKMATVAQVDERRLDNTAAALTTSSQHAKTKGTLTPVCCKWGS